MNNTQETIEMTPEIRVVMDDLQLPAAAIGIGLAKGYVAHVIDDKKPVGPGNVIWAMERHIDAMVGWCDREIDSAYLDVKASDKLYSQGELDEAVRKASSGSVETKGRDAYRRRAAGEKWGQIGPYAIGNARSHAKALGLPWPPSV